MRTLCPTYRVQGSIPTQPKKFRRWWFELQGNVSNNVVEYIYSEVPFTSVYRIIIGKYLDVK